MSWIKSEKKSHQRLFGFSMSLIFFLAAFFSPKGYEKASVLLSCVALCTLSVSLLFPSLLKQPLWLWCRFTDKLHWLMTQVLLGTAFIFVIIPAGLLMRLFANDPLQRHVQADTYWEPADTIQETFFQEKKQQGYFRFFPFFHPLLSLWAFLRIRKRFWLAPIILALLLLGLLITIGGHLSILGPFLYPF